MWLNQQCTCNTDARTCAAQRATNTARVFAWTRNPLVSNTQYITADDILQLRTFLATEQNARSTPSPSDNNATTYVHPGSCTVQTTAWTGTVSVSSPILATTFNQLVTLLNALKAREIHKVPRYIQRCYSYIQVILLQQYIITLEIFNTTQQQCICVQLCVVHILDPCNQTSVVVMLDIVDAIHM